MEFLQREFLSNTIAAYIEVAIAILIAFLIKRIVSKYLTRLLFRSGRSSWSGLSLESLEEKLIHPIERFFLIIVILVSLDRLNFPKELLFYIHKTSSRDILGSIAAALFITGFIGLLIRFIDFIALVIRHRNTVRNPGDYQLIYFFKDFLKAILIIFGIILVLKFSFNFNVGKLLTGLSIVGAALALAAKESLENLIASFVIFFDKPFGTGDVVKINNVLGRVERVGLRSTRIRTEENSLVTVPNKQMVDNILDNFSSRNLVRNEIKINIPSKYSSTEIERIIQKMRDEVTTESDVTNVSVYLLEISGDNAITQIIYFTPLLLNAQSVNQLRQKINIRLKSVLDHYTSEKV